MGPSREKEKNREGEGGRDRRLPKTARYSLRPSCNEQREERQKRKKEEKRRRRRGPRGRADRGDLSMNDAYLMVLVPGV
jgi:hypothetical protein